MIRQVVGVHARLHGRARCVDQAVTDGVSGALAITNNHALTWATAAQEAAGRSRSQGFGAYKDDGLELST